MKAPYQLPAYFSSHLIPLLVIDNTTLSIKDVNKAAVKAFGYTEKFLKASSLDNIITGATTLKQVKSIKSKSKRIADVVLKIKNGEAKLYDLFLHPISHRNKSYLLIEWHEKSQLASAQSLLALNSKDHFF